MRWAAAILAALTLVRLLVAAATPLSPDEAYYWIWSRALAPGYLDHPPMVALWIRFGTAMAGTDALGVRLLAPLSALLGSVLAAWTARDLLRLDGEGRIATIMLLNATLMVGAGAVTMTPDTPQLFFWTLALWCLGRMLRTGADSWFIGACAAIGLAFDSKYTGCLLVPVAAALLLGRGPRTVLTSPPIWTGAALCLLVVLPVVVWNAQHGFASFAKQGGRVGDIRLASAVRFVPELVLGQFGLATPLIAVLFCAGTWHVTRRAFRGDVGAAVVALAILLPAAIFIEHAFGDRVQANWPSVIYPTAAIAGASCRVHRLGWRSASVLGLTITLLVYAQAVLHPVTLPGRLDVTAVKFAGWRNFSRQVSRIDGTVGQPIAADDYALSAELAWCGARPGILGVEQRWSFTDLPRTPIGGTNVLLVRNARRGAPDPRMWARATELAFLGRGRTGQVFERYVLYRAAAKAGVTATRLPEPLPSNARPRPRLNAR